MVRILLLAATLLSGVTLGVLCAFGSEPVRALATNSDLIMPLSYGWDALHVPGGVSHYRLSRVPSLLPDAVLSGVAFAFVGLTRASVLVYAALQFGLFVLVGGWVAAALSGRRTLAGAGMVLALFATLLLAALRWNRNDVLLGAFLPIVHFGPMVGALAASWALCGALHRELAGTARLLLVGLGGALVFTSDKLVVPEFVLPALLACAAARLLDGVGWRRLGIVAGAMAAGMALGDVGLQVLRHAVPLRFQAPPVLTGAGVAASVRAFVRGLPGFMAADPLGVLVGYGVPLLGWAVLPALWRRMAPAERRMVRSCWLLGTTAMAAVVGFTACLYVDATTYRYALLCRVWPLLFSGAVLLRVASGFAPVAAAGAAAAALAAVFVGVQGAAVPMLRWEHPLAGCIRSLVPEPGSRAGLAQYWVARPLEFSLGYRVQIDQLAPDGRAFPWLSDARRFRQDEHDPSRPPEYGFIVMQGLDPAAVRARYGAPARVAACGGTEFWIYADGAALRRTVVRSDPELTDVD